MTQFLGIGIGAGLVSALLFGVLLKGTLLSIVLYLLAPLPILIVGLGWSHKAALVAAITGAVALAFLQPFLGLGFLAYLALPAWWLAYLALLGRPNADGTMEWYPTGRLLAWTAGTAFLAVTVITAPNYDEVQIRLKTSLLEVVKLQNQGRVVPQTPPEKSHSQPPAASDTTPESQPKDGVLAAELPSDLQLKFIDSFAAIYPGFAAYFLTMLLTAYLWLSARIVRVSGRLLRPWPDIPSTQMPRTILGLLPLGILFVSASGAVGSLGIALVGALAAAFQLQGLAAFHERSRLLPARPALLFGLYFIILATSGVALFALTLFGLADTAFNRRRPKEDAGRT
ncbi:DUF2232 domain-containing protein [Methylobacterium sp. Leaf85]|uniref:DUF2232 domain-containing protein n=1 Tax=Methylobacterium sp. Leaf85 TaxID=1736241 RepID=UPI00070140A7|nr:DUF2232 domain-containing protein [Methylobacterium sp. Leaf85]KQO54830.1 hypothetical protein ASF08_01895 [Methylobacterium sp. Leaf85]